MSSQRTPHHSRESKLDRLSYQQIFAGAPNLSLLLDTDARFTILDASDEYLRATMVTRDEIVGRPLFDVFPDNPDEVRAAGARTLRASLERVLASRSADSMAAQRF